MTSSRNKNKTCQRVDELTWANDHSVQYMYCYSSVAPVTAGYWFITQARTRHNEGFKPAGYTLVCGSHVFLARPDLRSRQERGNGEKAAQARATILYAG